ncbi:tyrosine recombinase [Paenibacillus physcomitrellae]|uniref:Tyrosine recombinase XerC n=1 Tax=Paenibacillus physcomitrellae TaxID=1619311 RepID=A0ABQ1FME3_9BACL|nr:tyrosine recombinase [Paenibacillus physcomitrellae]GGA22651.1 tyrosine recombinase XerD [Paenibacillus physcomitrellae]
MEERINAFILDLEERKGLTEATLSSYRRDLEQFAEYLAEREIETPDLVTRGVMAQYFVMLKDQGKASSTVTRASVSLRAFFKHLLRESQIRQDPFLHLESPKAARKTPAPLSLQETMALLDMPDTSTLLGLRDKAMLELLYATGIRVSELICLNRQDVDVRLRFVRCGEGTSHERIVPFAASTGEWLERYLAEARQTLLHGQEDEQALFPNRLGGRITRQGFWKTIKKYGQAAGIQAEITPHTLRSSFASHLLSGGADLRTVQELMGHADISSTQAYLNRSGTNIKAVYDKFHPRAAGANIQPEG